MSRLSLTFENYRFAEQVLNSRLTIKKEFLNVLQELNIPENGISRPNFNNLLLEKLTHKGWKSQVPVFGGNGMGETKLDFEKDRIGVEIQFGHASFIGIDLLKFQVGSYSGLDLIDVGIYVMATRDFIRSMNAVGQKWRGSLTFEKVRQYLPHFRSAIHIPILVIGLAI